MPQLIPYYFSHQNNFSFFFIMFLIYLFSKYLLPASCSLITTRTALFTV